MLCLPAGARAQVAADPVLATSTAAPGDPALPGSASSGFGSDPFLFLPSVPVQSDPVLSQERFRRRGGGTVSRGVTVLERSRPEYDPVGIRAGGFTIFPVATASVNYNSNVFKQPEGEGDAFGVVHLEALAKSNWIRHRLVIESYVESREYVSKGSESTFNYSGSASGQLDIDRRFALTGLASHERSFLDRGAVGEIIETRQPVRVDRSIGQLGAIGISGRFTSRVTGTIERADFDDARALDGSVVNQQFRDGTRYGINGQLVYAITPARSAFVSVTRDEWNFRQRSDLARDYASYEVLGGIESEITSLIRGRVAVGYIWATFADDSASGASGLSVDARVDYLVTPITTLKANARRALRNVASPASPAALVTSLGVGVDHELLRNLILSASVAYENADYVDNGLSSEVVTGLASARYLMSNRWRFDLALTGRKRSVGASNLDRSFSAAEVSAGVSFQF